MDELEDLQEEFRLTLNDLREKTRTWDRKITEMEKLINHFQMDLEQVSKTKKGNNIDILERIVFIEKNLNIQEKKTRGLQKKWELILLIQVLLLFFLFFNF